MAVHSSVLRVMLEGGATAEMIVAVVEAAEAADERAKVKKRENNAERQRRCRERNAESRGVTPVTRDECDTPSFPSPVSPTPPSNPNLSNPSTPYSPPSKAKKAVLKPAELTALVETLWSLQPVTGGKRKATRSDVAKALEAALKRGGDPADIEAAFRAYYALPECQREEGRYSMGAAVLLNADRWRDFTPGNAASKAALAAFPGPADLRAAVIAATDDAFAANYLDPSGWQEVPRKALIPRNSFALEKLRSTVGRLLAERDIDLTLVPERAVA